MECGYVIDAGRDEKGNARVLEMIAQVHGMPTTIFTMLLAKIYKRNK